MSRMLNARVAFRFSIVMAGMMLADDRSVAASWFVAAGVGDGWDRFYDCLIRVGRNAGSQAVSGEIAVLRRLNRRRTCKFGKARMCRPTVEAYCLIDTFHARALLVLMAYSIVTCVPDSYTHGMGRRPGAGR